MLFETVAVREGVPQYLQFHQERFDRSRVILGLDSKSIRLVDHIQVPTEAFQGLYRCRIDYAHDILGVSYRPISPVEVRRVALAEDTVEYSHKWCDRNRLSVLREQFPGFDDVVVTHNGLLTDSTVANIALFDGVRWVTPDTPLLHGTTRARLLSKGMLLEERIHVEDLGRFSSFRLINALRDFEEQEPIPIAALSRVS